MSVATLTLPPQVHPWVGFGVLCAYVAVALAVAVWLLLMLAWRWLIEPLRARTRPFVVEEVRPESEQICTLVLAPKHGYQPGVRFAPGQFAWIRLDHPFSLREEHPFTIASGAHDHRRIEFTIRQAGDFTRKVRALQPGRLVYLDGPHGSFSSDHVRGGGAVLIGRSERVDVRRLRALLALLDVERDPLAFVERAVPAGLDGRVVDEHIRSATVRGGEAEPLLRVEPLDSSFGHCSLLAAMVHRGPAIAQGLPDDGDLSRSGGPEVGRACASRGAVLALILREPGG